MKISQLFIALIIVAIWGANVAIGKIAVMQIPALAFLSFRFLISGLIFLPFAKLKNGDFVPLLKVAIILNVCHYGFIFSSMKILSASTLALIMQSQVPIAILLGAVIFNEKLSIKSAVGIALALIGLLIIFGIPDLNIFGFILALLGCVSWALGSIEMKKMQNINLPAFMAYTTLLSVPFLMILSYIFETNVVQKTMSANSHEIIAVLAYQIILGCASMMAWQRLMSLNDVNKIASMTLLQPLFGIIAGIIIFHETITVAMITGGLITLLGVSLVVIKRKDSK